MFGTEFLNVLNSGDSDSVPAIDLNEVRAGLSKALPFIKIYLDANNAAHKGDEAVIVVRSVYDEEKEREDLQINIASMSLKGSKPELVENIRSFTVHEICDTVEASIKNGDMEAVTNKLGLNLLSGE